MRFTKTPATEKSRRIKDFLSLAFWFSERTFYARISSFFVHKSLFVFLCVCQTRNVFACPNTKEAKRTKTTKITTQNNSKRKDWQLRTIVRKVLFLLFICLLLIAQHPACCCSLSLITSSWGRCAKLPNTSPAAHVISLLVRRWAKGVAEFRLLLLCHVDRSGLLCFCVKRPRAPGGRLSGSIFRPKVAARLTYCTGCRVTRAQHEGNN